MMPEDWLIIHGPYQSFNNKEMESIIVQNIRIYTLWVKDKSTPASEALLKLILQRALYLGWY